MTAKVILVTNQKGGCGKTTLSMNLAGIIGSKFKVLLIDGDPRMERRRCGCHERRERL